VESWFIKMCRPTKSGASNGKLSDSEKEEINHGVGLQIIILWNANDNK